MATSLFDMKSIALYLWSWLLAAISLGVPSASRANDLPITGNRAAEEVRAIENGVFAAVEGDEKARLHVYSIFSNKLAWNRTSLDVCFWNGTPARQAEVIVIADTLTRNLPIKFKWHAASGAINICPDFGKPSGAWNAFKVRVSLEPNSSLLISGDRSTDFFAMVGQQKPNGRQATINLPFGPLDSGAKVRNKVLHEFCHVLGCLHEFQRDECVKDFKKSAIVSEFGLTDQQYHDNFETIPTGHAARVTASGTFDPKSVMMYLLKPAWFERPSRCAVTTVATTLSTLDEDGLQRAYALAGLSIRLGEFKLRATAARSEAAAQRQFAASLRKANDKLALKLGNLRPDYVKVQGATSEALAKEADAQADGAEADAKSWELNLEQERAIRRALTFF